MAGTPLYLAPELIGGGRPGPWSDLYSLGVMLYELVCGVTPFTGLVPAAVLHAQVSLLPGRPDGFDDRLWNLVWQLLGKDPGRRPGDAGVVAGQLAVSLGTAIPEGTVLPPAQLADREAEITTRPGLRPYMRLWIEIAAAAARREEPFPGIAAQIMAGFRAWIEPRLDVANEKERASAALAVIAICDGLALIDICAGDDAIEAARSALPLGPRQRR